MDYSTQHEIESRIGHRMQISERGQIEICTIEVGWAPTGWIGDGGHPTGKHLAKIDQVLAEYGFVKISEREHEGPFGLLAGGKTILTYRKI